MAGTDDVGLKLASTPTQSVEQLLRVAAHSHRTSAEYEQHRDDPDDDRMATAIVMADLLDALADERMAVREGVEVARAAAPLMPGVSAMQVFSTPAVKDEPEDVAYVALTIEANVEIPESASGFGWRVTATRGLEVAVEQGTTLTELAAKAVKTVVLHSTVKALP